MLWYAYAFITFFSAKVKVVCILFLYTSILVSSASIYFVLLKLLFVRVVFLLSLPNGRIIAHIRTSVFHCFIHTGVKLLNNSKN